tara:strand:- start:5228 stop:5830 length:603 start_codon:yes stop_codon:yes gene_type:complete
MSRLITNAIRSTSASADAITMDGSGNATFPANVTCSGTATGFGGGKLVNYGSVIKTDTFSQSLGQAVWSNDVITLSYTAASSSNKLLLVASLTVGYQHGQSIKMRFTIGGSVITAATGDAAGSRGRATTEAWINASSHATNMTFNYLHSSPSTSAATYGVQIGQKDNGTQTVYLNRSASDNNYDYDARYTSSLVIMEFSA